MFVGTSESVKMLEYHADAYQNSVQKDRIEAYFYFCGEGNAYDYSQIAKEIQEQGYHNVGLLTGMDTFEYPLWYLLNDDGYRIEHINALETLLQKENIDYICVHGSLNKKEQVENMNLVKDKSLIIATTSYFGEGIDFPHLNTIMFATPISYYGRLVQYLGRIGRGNQECLAIDFLDSKNAMLNSAYKKRLEGYKQMHYK